jgi:polyferredoxin
LELKQRQQTQNQARDTGLALLLILLLIVYFSENVTLIIPSIGVLVLIMIWPKIFSPLAPLWFGLSSILGTIVSKIILSLLYFLIVTPVGIFRRMLGKDSMKLKDWRNGRDSVLLERNHIFTKKDIDKPY